MKCSSRLLCGLLISCLAFRGFSEDLSVIQSPSNITVSEGDSAEISCCWNITKAKVAWYINETKQDTKLEIQAPQKQNCSTLHLTNIIKNDAGHYVCEVTQDIPVLKKKNGTGTNLYVSDRQLDETTTDKVSHTSSHNTTMMMPAPSLPILPLSLAISIGLLTLCLAFSICKMRNSCKKSERVVIHQTPHSEGEEHEHTEEEEGSTSSSRGSLQWYQVPVYWSYFDLQRGEEQCQ